MSAAIEQQEEGYAVRYDVLGRLCAQRRAKEGISLRAVARETGISASTLSRIENGHSCDTEQVVALSRWLNVPLDHVAGLVVADVPQQIKAILLSDPKLTKDEAEALCATFSVLYRSMANEKPR